MEQANKVARALAEDLGVWVTSPASDVGSSVSPAEGIRELGRLRDEGLITADEFEAKKDELLRRL